MSPTLILGIILFGAGFLVMASGKSLILGFILVIVGGIVARTSARGVVGNKLRQRNDTDSKPE